MQDRINGVNADPTNDLQMLQSDAGVTAKSSGAKRTIAVALVGGLIFGCLLAWVLGAASRRLSSPAELMEKARIEPLVVIPPGGGTRAELQRERQLRQLAATVALLDVPKPAVVAVAAVERMPGTDEIAESLARYRADHGARTVLVHADGAPAPLDAVEGDIESVAVRWLLASSESGGRMREVFPVGDPQDAHGLLGMEHLGKLVTSLRSRADLIVIRSPAVSESAESYMVCAAADRTLLVAGAGSSADSVVAARDQMERVGVSLLGVAFVERSRRRRAARRATSHGDVGARLMDMGEPYGDQDRPDHTDDRSSEAAAAPDASSARLDETIQCRPEVIRQPGMIKRIAPPIDRRFEGRALMDGAAGSALVVGAMIIVLTGLALVRSRVPGGLGALLLLVVVGAIIVAACLRYPPLAVVVLLGAMFLRLALPHLIVADPFLIAYALVVASAAVWMWQQRRALPRVTFVEVAMVLYTLWCYGSMVLPHQYPPVEFPLNGGLDDVPRFIEDSARSSRSRCTCWGGGCSPGNRRCGSCCGRSSASPCTPRMVSIFQFYAPSLVWPRYIVDAPGWPGRAVGVFNQPVGNGMVLIIGFVIAIVLASDRGEPAWRRALLWLYALTSTLAIYLTHTRADLPGLRACADPRRPPGAGSPRRVRRPDRRDHPRDRLELVDLHQL